MKISICGATGYTGEELLRILAGHPEAEVVHITSESQTGVDIGSVYPHFSHIWQLTLASMEQLDTVAADSDVVFIALPHGHAMKAAATIMAHGKKVIDLGADYRFRDPAVYEQWYKLPHTHPDSGAVYGLTELYREQVKQAEILANPGCYTTASILALAPLVKNGLVDPDSIVIDAKSGISGAGKGLNLSYHYPEAAENVKAYNIGGHRHTPEIEQALSGFAGKEITLSFTPHLMPMTRGIFATCYAKLQSGVSAGQVDDAFVSQYGDEFFIRLLGRGGYPTTKNTRGSNYCDIGWHIDPRTGRVVVVSALDNLVKGAAGQAVQNMNVMFGIDERAGLTQVPLYL
ncbi:MAG: N-acetyl-gamma-glutamyl-phosphate reductase [Sporomusaceae bacterium]|nr:N-acetyl-gamma-glutamyl-phosphate reductase [Sporomusaceae bacterium]